uniref:Uncharacterized protein ycf35 n=1 Tax=Cliftonaea pectinata TaxID=2007206 RepID=A0A1Z1MQG8_9FLOR|nr:hypothetical protein [Cliftonaea pectinata]ARW68109.1 hypothetical protein [Cliftonaea pectinata]
MSHFSKIKTNISNLSILKKTIKQLGFKYKLVLSPVSSDLSLNVYHKSTKLLCSFVKNNFEYNLVVDLQLWNLKVDFYYFFDKLCQQYAYNIITYQSNLSGFDSINETLHQDGSIVITMQKWSMGSAK